LFEGKLRVNSKVVVLGMKLLGLQTEKRFQAVKMIEMVCIYIHLNMN